MNSRNINITALQTQSNCFSEGIIISRNKEIIFFNTTVNHHIDLHNNKTPYQNLIQSIYPNDKNRVLEKLNQISDRRESIRPFTFRILDKNEEIRWIYVNHFSIEVERNSALLFIINDITDFILLKDDLLFSQEKYKSIIDNIKEGVYEVDLKGNLSFVNDACCTLFGYNKKKLLQLNYQDIIDNKSISDIQNIFNNVYKTGQSANIESWSIVNKFNKKKYINASVTLIKDCNQNKIGFRGIIRDITEKKEAENKLSKKDERYRLVVENISDTIYTLGPNGYLNFISSSAPLKTGLSKETFLKTHYLDLVVDEHRALAKKYMEEIRSQDSGYSAYHELKIKTAFAHDMWIGQTIKVKKNNISKEKEFYFVARDITAIKEFKDKLEESEKKYRELVEEKTQDIIFSLDKDLRFATVNSNMAKLLGYNEHYLSGKHIQEIFHRDNNDSDNLQIQSLLELINLVILKKKKNIHFKASCSHKSLGDPLTFNIKLDPVMKENNLIGVIGFMNPDIDDPMRDYLTHQEIHYTIDNKLTTVNNVVNRLTRDLLKFYDVPQVKQISLALTEIIVNAIEHGNLHISFTDKNEAKNNDNYFNLLRERLQLSENKNKKVRITYILNDTLIKYIITDEGNGFNHINYSNRSFNELNDSLMQNGRGLMIAENIFTSLNFNEKGNEVTLIKYINQDIK